MNEFLQTKKMQLKCLAPIHIGSGNKLSKNEYIFAKSKGIIYLLQQNKWLQFLQNFNPANGKKGALSESKAQIKDFAALAQALGHKSKDYLQEYKKYIIRNAGNGKPLPLYQWCIDNDIKMTDAASCALAQTYIKSDKNDLNDMMPFMRQADGSIYIPGSSIKGAIRTALLYKQVKTAPQYKSWQRSLQQIRPSAKKDFDNLAKEIERAVFYKYRGFTDKGRCVTDARADIMRGLRIGDACVNGAVKTQVYRKCDISLYKDKQGEAVKKLPLYRECVPIDTSFSFAMTVEKQFMQACGVNSIEDVLQIMADYTAEIVSLEKEVFNAYGQYWNGRENMANIIIGGGSGFLTKTIIYSLLPRMEAVNVVKNYLDYKFKKHKHNILDRQVSPRTLKVAGDINNMYHIGLGLIE
ncbi:type III-A CRISPR-associated RAMP protein Csm5 [Pectinatus sottacetonis]|uniref:type III-A CRISPR-associated RAMP protein Csm5 n=1 Tax=Pectinatus sottacetonis TaxID=1002795 RepID=UPI0018C4CD29|nr:type III-A CRISPR-associated RAMP protein Csm5 [Pectinatus sottacetonis]